MASRKFPRVKIVLALVGLLSIALVGYFVIYVPLQAKAGWEKSRSELSASGESLSLADFVPPPIPDADNFFADPLWQELADRVPVKESAMIKYVPRLAEKDRKLYQLSRPFTETERHELEKAFPEFAPIARGKTRIGIAKALDSRPREDVDPKRSAEFILALLSPSEPVMAHIRQLAKRSSARFPLRYEDGPAMGAEHLTYLITAGQWLSLHAGTSLALGRPDVARDDILDALKLSSLIAKDPPLISQFVAVSVWEDGLSGIHQGLESHAWSETDLDQFQKRLEGVDFYANLARCLRLDRASFLEWFEPMVNRGKTPSVDNFKVNAALYRMYCFPGDMTLYCRVIQTWIDTLEHRPAQGLNQKSCPEPLMEYLAAHPSLLDSYRIIMSRLTLPALSGAICRSTRAQTKTLLAQTAVALERFYLQKGAYPEGLEALVPEYLPIVPLDPTTLRPLVYRRESPGHFRLWSAGWNATDDNGAVERNISKGDWLWDGKSF